ncbi:MAG: hypothetical protein ACO3YO_09395 [Chthoniobacterales bacterium]|jgi:hypothetical protein
MSVNHRPSRLSSYSKVTVGSLAAASAAGSAEAAIVFFDVNPDQTILNGNSLSFGSINLVAETYSLADSTAPSFTLSSTGAGPEFSGNQIEAGALFGVYTYRLSDGDPISGALTFSSTPSTPAYWGAGDSGYLALRLDLGGGNYNYGWAQVSVASPATSITITSFAFEGDINTAITAGDQGGPAAVPEPGTMAVGAGLFALAVGAHLRRRREKKAAASDALLNLAAGARGVEKFRADKAA